MYIYSSITPCIYIYIYMDMMNFSLCHCCLDCYFSCDKCAIFVRSVLIKLSLSDKSEKDCSLVSVPVLI